MSNDPTQHTIRRIVLPSGRSIEVIRFRESDEAAAGLHVCEACGCGLVQPVSWTEASDGHWELTLNCPNCGWEADGIYTHDEVTELEEQLDEGVSQMLEDLKRLTEANMAEELERFAEALAHDLILPEDF
jgi:hypothetical protein